MRCKIQPWRPARQWAGIGTRCKSAVQGPLSVIQVVAQFRLFDDPGYSDAGSTG